MTRPSLLQVMPVQVHTAAGSLQPLKSFSRLKSFQFVTESFSCNNTPPMHSTSKGEQPRSDDRASQKLPDLLQQQQMLAGAVSTCTATGAGQSQVESSAPAGPSTHVQVQAELSRPGNGACQVVVCHPQAIWQLQAARLQVKEGSQLRCPGVTLPTNVQVVKHGWKRCST